MRAICITLSGIQKSVRGAQRCAASAKGFGITVEHFEAVDRFFGPQFMADLGLAEIAPTGTSDPGAVCGCFASHFMVWRLCSESRDTILVLEHDAVIVGPIPRLDAVLQVVNIGRRGWGGDPQCPKIGCVPLSTPIFRGTFGYLVTPAAARILVKETLRLVKIIPVDHFLSRKRFGFLFELNPYVVDTCPEFTTIQHVAYNGEKETVETAWKDYKPVPRRF